MVPGTQNLARAERSRARPSPGGGRDGSVPGLLLKFHGRLSWDLEVELLMYPPGGVTVRPLMYAILLGTGVRVSMGQLGVTVCWTDSLGGVATPPSPGLVLRGILLFVLV